MYNIDTATEVRITANNSAQEYPGISGNSIVWHDNRHGNNDIYMYNIDTQVQTQVTTVSSSQINPSISGNTIVWQDDRKGNEDIFYSTFPKQELSFLPAVLLYILN